MNIANDAQQKIEAYLGRLRRNLRGLGPAEVDEIIAELRSHILDKASAEGEPDAASVDATVSRLGSAEELASAYITDTVLAQVAVSRSPLRILGSLFRWATLSVAGVAVLLVCIVGYFLGAALFLCALLKPFHPQTAGLWMISSSTGDWELSLRMGFGGVPANGHELLGWWMIPAGLILGVGMVLLTTRFALWAARKYRHSRPLP
jgi:hypothetical protein